MKIKNRDESRNDKNGKKYERTIYVCEDCDVWVTTEVSKNFLVEDGENK